MSILDRLKKTRQDDEDEDEDSQDGNEGSEDEVVGKGGLWGKLGSLRGIGGNTAGMVGNVLKRGGRDDDDDADNDVDNDADDNEITGLVVTEPSPAVTIESQEDSIAALLSGDPDPVVAVSPEEEDDGLPLVGGALITESTAEASGESASFDIFSVKVEVSPALRDLAMSQDAVTAQELAEDLDELVGRLSRISHGD